MGIADPPASADISDRALDCEFALKPAFLALVGLADSHMLGEMENAGTDQAIQKALRRLKLNR